MLKVRVIPSLLFREGSLVKGESFDSWRNVGAPMQAVKVFNQRDVDELVLLDIGATPASRGPDFRLIEALSEECFVPLTVGGGVSGIGSVRQLLRSGADKVVINTAAYSDISLIHQAASLFGTQCVVGGIDFSYRTEGPLQCYSHCGRTPTGRDPVTWARELERSGAGEILLTFIDHDGTLMGYDLGTTKAVSRAVRIPVIASGGAASYDDMRRAVVEAGAAAVAAGAIFQFTEATPLEAKKYLAKHGVPVRYVAKMVS